MRGRAARARVAMVAVAVLAGLVAALAASVRITAARASIEPDSAIVVDHARHRDLACATCHPGQKPPRHQRCAGCHDGSGAAGRGPAMTACAGCHPATAAPTTTAPMATAPMTAAPTATAPSTVVPTTVAPVTAAPTTAAPTTVAVWPRTPTLVRAEVNVRGMFAHARHATHGAAAAKCTACHAAVRDAHDNALPAPDTASCAAARCHDGTAAFAVTVACRRCHAAPADPAFKVERPTARYSHATHAQLHVACATCHPLSRGGEVTVVGHAPCVACHAADFGRRAPRICGACHNGTEPWRALVADRGPPERTEFGATLDHSRHTTACVGCHALTTPVSQLRPPRGHRACTTGACHAISGGPAPQLGACEACHRRGLVVERQASRLAAPWSVRTTFDHATHARTGQAPLACTACHADLRAAEVLALATPAKASCAPCHDGKAAFKLTGTACTRCHPGPSR